MSAFYDAPVGNVKVRTLIYMEFVTNTKNDHLLVGWTIPLVDHYTSITEVIGSR